MDLDQMLEEFSSAGYSDNFWQYSEEQVDIPEPTEVEMAAAPDEISGYDDGSYKDYDYYEQIGIDPKSIDYSGSTTTQSDVDRMIGSQPNSPGLLATAGKLVDSAGGLIKQNPKLAEILAGAVGSAYKSSEARKAAEQSAEEKAATRQRISDSITGMKQPTPGLIGHMVRMNGSRVYNDNGGLNR